MITTLSAMQLSLVKGAIIGFLALVLMGCGAARLGYSNGPTLVWWWLDGYADFSREQAPPIERGIERWFDWHRATQLPAYAALLAELGPAVIEPTSTAQVCRWQTRVREALDPALERAIELAAELLPDLSEAQFRHIELRYAKGNDELRSDFLQPDPAERAQESVRRTVERAERLYGRLDEPQRRVIAAGVAASPFDPERWLADRLRRQRDTLELLRELVATRADRDRRLAGLRALAVRLERSPDPAYRAYQQALAEYNCAFAARVHNATTPEQRRQARDNLKGWEADLRALTASPGRAAS
ncbi:MAG TPA: DUF6279 family lipoprotein [Rubrivivax sp.]|nr:DUF6279 family lipoprotein [Rubrivivax sp.]